VSILQKIKGANLTETSSKKNASMNSKVNLPERIPNEPFFCRDKGFYDTLFKMMIVLILQNIITYSVNVADNVMLGSYSQDALAGAAAVNQLQYILQQVIVAGIGEGLVVLASQYWGLKNTEKVQNIFGAALCIGLAVGLILTTVAFLSPISLIRIFTNDVVVQHQAIEYLSLMRYTYLIFIVSNLLYATLRSVQVVGIAFKISCATLFVNVFINYILIYGKFGAPELGIKGAAIGTLTARIVELAIILIYCRKKGLPVKFRIKEMLGFDKKLLSDFIDVSIPCVVSALLFSCAVAAQTAIFGHISSSAMAASSAAGTLFQYFKMVSISVASATSVLIGKTIGSGELTKLRSYVRTLQVLFIAFGVLTFGLLMAIRIPVLSFYSLSHEARIFAMQMTIIQAFILIATSYQMPCQVGIIRGGGDTKWVMISDLIYSWAFTVPFSLLAAFVFKWSFAAVVICLNIDQVIKCATVGYKVNSYTWVKKLAK